MDALKLKIFDVLTEKIAVSEFEKWLYNSEEFMSKINSNSFYFDVISINYKDEKWKKGLDNLVKEKYDENFMILYGIKMSCLEILESDNPEKTYKILSKLSLDFDYDSDYDISWKLLGVFEYLGSFEGSMYYKNELLEEAKFYAKQVIELTKKSKGFDETKKALIRDLIKYRSMKTGYNLTITQKIFAFFKKI